MSLSDLASLGNLVGGIAVLVSLAYLSVQVRQNSKHTRALIQQGRAQRGWEFNMRLADASTSLAQVWISGRSADPTMTEEQEVRYLGICRAAFLAHEDSFRQHRAGLYEDAAYEGSLLVLKSRVAHPGMRAAWRMLRDTFDPEFRLAVDEIVRATPSHAPSRSQLKDEFSRELKGALATDSAQTD
jgi:hypothetical protein